MQTQVQHSSDTATVLMPAAAAGLTFKAPYHGCRQRGPGCTVPLLLNIILAVTNNRNNSISASGGQEHIALQGCGDMPLMMHSNMNMYVLLQEQQPQVPSRLIWATYWQAFQTMSLLMRPSISFHAGQRYLIPFLSRPPRHQRLPTSLLKVPRSHICQNLPRQKVL